MNLKRFTGRSSREALGLVRQAFGKDAVVMSTRTCAEGVEVLAMAPESLPQLEKLAAEAPAAAASPTRPAASRQARPEIGLVSTDGPVERDVEQLAMSTLSFQDYVRERMLKRRRTELDAQGAGAAEASGAAGASAASEAPATVPAQPAPPRRTIMPTAVSDSEAQMLRALQDRILAEQPPGSPPQPQANPRPAVPGNASIELQQEQQAMLRELRSVRGLIEQRFGELAFIEKLQRQPRQALLSHRLLECGFSPALVRKLVESLPEGGDETEWAGGILQRNLLTGEQESALEDQGGVYALIGPTGVGKTTSTAKLAAAFAARHGAGNLGLITLDAYRIGAHEQLRAYGRILGVPVHTAHDRASLDDLLELLAGKKMVLIDTAGMAQRDTRTKELLDMLSHRAVNRLLVVNAASQGETIEDVLGAYRAGTCRGVVLSKIDEAMKLAPALDALIRHKVKVLAVANGQRVPEDWHRLSAQALVQRALRSGGSAAWKLDNVDVKLVFSGQPPHGQALAAAGA
ncbi:MAG TPA: flagellar biosynthesis protein FlhF [Rubrivivax sp.]|nr:flagellar biosynthesis protein FlhF [Burkholderiales bacterium]HNT37794.1 flagellar biosynthesis protein FlhF [Rubrivivax sp.]